MTAKQTTRRQFLSGQAAVESLTDLSDGTDPSVACDALWPAWADSPAYLVQFARRAMACEFEVLLNAGQYPHGPEAALEALDLVEALEGQLSVYRDDSQISQLNRRASEEAVSVQGRLFQLLQLAVQLYVQTQGGFDITCSPLSEAWGFCRREGRLPEQADLAQALRLVGSNHLKLNEPEQTIRFGKSGVQINLGGIGKGYALDRCAELLVQADVDDFLLHGGQSSVLARGHRHNRSTETRSAPQGGWVVGVRHPLRPERRFAEIRLYDRALATSGSGTQSFHHQGRRYGHILDPRTGWPAEVVLSSTVLAPSAAVADALATAFYVLGVEKATEYCHHHGEVSALLVTPGASSGTITIHSIGLDDDQCSLMDELKQ